LDDLTGHSVSFESDGVLGLGGAGEFGIPISTSPHEGFSLSGAISAGWSAGMGVSYGYTRYDGYWFIDDAPKGIIDF